MLTSGTSRNHHIPERERIDILPPICQLANLTLKLVNFGASGSALALWVHCVLLLH